MPTKMGNENAVVTDPVVGEVTLDDGTVKHLHQSGFTTAKGVSDGGVNDGAATSAQGDGAHEASGGDEQPGGTGDGG